MALNLAIRGAQIKDATISGVHILAESITEDKLDVYNSPTTDYILKWNGSKFEWTAAGSLVINEVPTGDINGSNVTFTLANTPSPADSEQVYLNGIHQEPGGGNDYTISGDTITFSVAPETNDILLVSYLTAAGMSGGAVHKYATTAVTISGTTTLTTGDFGKTYTMTASAGNCEFDLPSVDAGDVGGWFRFVKASTASGTLTVDAADSDIIADSSAGGTIYDDEATETYATITIQLAAATQWVITGAHGSWTTT